MADANLRIKEAKRAMKTLGIGEDITAQALKTLYHLYRNNLDPILAEDYRVLADYIFENHEKIAGVVAKKRKDSQLLDNSQPPPKKLQQEQMHQNAAEPSQLITRERYAQTESISAAATGGGVRLNGDKRKQPAQQCPISLQRQSKDKGKARLEPCIDSPVPLAVMSPPSSSRPPNQGFGDHYSSGSGHGRTDHPKSEQNASVVVANPRHRSETSLVLADTPEESSSSFLIASSSSGQVKVFLSYNTSTGHSDFQMPNIGAVFKSMDYKCKSYKSVDHTFSVRKLIKELCECFSDIGMSSTDNWGEKDANMTSTDDSLKNSNIQTLVGAKRNCQGNFHISAISSNGPLKIHSSADEVISRFQGSRVPNGQDGHCFLPSNKNVARKSHKKRDLGSSQSDSQSLVLSQHHQLINDVRPPHDVNDISKGEETVKISVVNEINSELYPPPFHYIPHNTVHQNAYINFSLARIGDEDCCADCYGDCTSSSLPCACARETGGEFAYTVDGLLKGKFVDEVISMMRHPEKHHWYFCEECPIESFKNSDKNGKNRDKNEDKKKDSREKCKGHLMRKFIKECWRKCGCNKSCGNRVVQRGITHSLQVFFTPEGKGWGLRTVDYLPKGAFVCEYVGEILTNTELFYRNMERARNERHTYPITLDSDWGSEGRLDDDHALCLDATCYGNVARFINHRCYDATLIAVPVEVETPDRHYYHVAFFTAREVNALEELTWDYGIDFDDVNHPIKAFQCRCGSTNCGDKKGNKMALIVHS